MGGKSSLLQGSKRLRWSAKGLNLARKISIWFTIKFIPQSRPELVQQIKIYSQMELGVRTRRNINPHNKENLQGNLQTAANRPSEKVHLLPNTLQEVTGSSHKPLFQVNSTGGGSAKIERLDRQPLACLMGGVGSRNYSNTQAYLATYWGDIKEEAQRQQKLGSYLDNHHIDFSLRGRMADWLIEVSSSYKFEPKTYFDAVLLLDKYLLAKKQPVEPSEMHSLGVAALVLSTKQNQVFPLNLLTAYDRIVHRKIPISKLEAVEADIMATLDYKLNQWSFYDIATTYLASDPHGHLLPVLTYICKLIVIEYGLYTSQQPVLLGAAAAWVAVQICKVEEPRWTPSFVEVERYGRKIIGLMSGFRSVFPNFRNPEKFCESGVLDRINQFIEDYEHKMI